jgi:hypothetical protein
MTKDYLISNNGDFFDKISSSNQKNKKNTQSTDKKMDSISVDLLNKKDLLYVINNIYMDYAVYKKKLIKNIIYDINLFNELFDNETADILINILILKKKNKINNIDFNLFEPVYKFIDMLEKIERVDQEDYLPLIIGFFKISLLVARMKKFFDNFIFKDLINFDLFVVKINNLNKIIIERNYFIKIFNELTSTDNDDDFKEKISGIAHILSMDFFMYHNSEAIFNKVINNILIEKPNLITFGNKQNFEKFIKKFIKHKEVFLIEYNKQIKIYKEVYMNLDLESKIKGVLKKNENISKLVEDLNYIKEIQ